MRTTSSVTNTDFPFADDKVPFILVMVGIGFGKDGRGFEHASTESKKRELVLFAMQTRSEGDDCHLLAAWPGATRTDVFEVDDLDEALAAFG